MEKRFILLFFTFVGTLLWIWGVFNYHENTAQWWGISIWVFAILIVAAVVGAAWLFGLLSPDETTPKGFLIILVLFLLVSVCEGIFISEPALAAQQQHPAAHSTAASTQSDDHESFFYYSWWSSATSSSSQASSSSHSGKGAGYLILALILIALLLLSAIVPHFWIVALFAGLVLLWFFTYKEYRIAHQLAAGSCSGY